MYLIFLWILNLLDAENSYLAFDYLIFFLIFGFWKFTAFDCFLFLNFSKLGWFWKSPPYVAVILVNHRLGGRKHTDDDNDDDDDDEEEEEEEEEDDNDDDGDEDGDVDDGGFH